MESYKSDIDGKVENINLSNFEYHYLNSQLIDMLLLTLASFQFKTCDSPTYNRKAWPAGLA